MEPRRDPIELAPMSESELAKLKEKCPGAQFMVEETDP